MNGFLFTKTKEALNSGTEFLPTHLRPANSNLTGFLKDIKKN